MAAEHEQWVIESVRSRHAPAKQTQSPSCWTAQDMRSPRSGATRGERDDSTPAEAFSVATARRVGAITLNRPERKNPLTFESYAELRDLFRSSATPTDVRAIVITGAGGNFCSGGDVHEIIGPLTEMACRRCWTSRA